LNQDVIDKIGEKENRWIATQHRDEFDTVDHEAAIEKCRDAIDSMEIAADVHPLGPSILILRGKGLSFAKIAERLHVAESTVRFANSKVLQAIRAQAV
jgi:DNA-binding NarL/FixJ family response regulator